MRHRATLLRATLTALLMLVALGAAFAEGAPPLPFPPPGVRPGAHGLPGGVTTVPKNVPEGAPRWVSTPEDLKRPPAEARVPLPGGPTMVPKIVTTVRVAPPAAVAAPPPTSPSQNSPIKVKLRPGHGVWSVPAEINGALTFDLMVDSGAALASINAETFAALKRAGAIEETDIIERQRIFGQADGSQWRADVVVLESVKVGDVVVENVKATVAPSNAPQLLGQAFLQRFKSWSIDNASHELVLEQEAPARTVQTTEINPHPLSVASPPMAVDLYGCDGDQACVKIAEATRCDSECQQACKGYRFDYTTCFTVWGPKFEFQRNQRKSGIK
jgi:clan AA aspartic protease (TIGR02281 family)